MKNNLKASTDPEATTNNAPVGFTRPIRPQVALRFPSVLTNLLPWVGSVTAYTWPKVLVYGIYTTLVVLLFKLSCDDDNDKTNTSTRCRFANKKLRIETMLELWMVFTAFLFQSFVNAGIRHYRQTLDNVRSIQGRFHELSLLLHAHAAGSSTSTTTTGDGAGGEELLVVVRRFLLALPYILYAGQRFGGEKGRHCYQQAETILLPDEYQILMERKESDRPHVLLTWLSIAIQRAIESGSFIDVSEGLTFRLRGIFERLRGTYGSLVDSLDDPILPFPFANLIILNVYIVSLFIPFISVEALGYYVIPAAVVYFWFLDGMITFVFFAHDPFLDMQRTSIMGVTSENRTRQPLIDVDRALLEMVGALPRRFPEAASNLPPSVLQFEKEKETLL